MYIMISITRKLAIDESAIRFVFIRASGPGGQKVNKAATAVQLRFDVARSSLPGEIQKRLGRLAGKKINQEGILILDARRFRSQEQNRRDAVERLTGLIRKAAEKPKPRLPTKPSSAAKERRLEEKHRRSEQKRRRRFEPEI
jgi:ribosome-associated protein